MRFVRFWDGQRVQYGKWEKDRITVLEGSIYHNYRETGKTYGFNEVQILAPCEPSKILAVGLNYRDHAEEMQMTIPDRPIIFAKPPSAVIGPGASIVHPALSKRIDYEAELAVVIGEICKDVSEGEAWEKIFGYTCANDVTARDLQPVDGQWTIAKSFDTFCPLGPAIVTGLDPANLDIQLSLDGQVKQKSNTKQLVFSVNYLVSFLSQIMTLFPGDVILTGTPGGVGPMQPGQEVKVEIQEIGTLTNTVVSP